jgi:hypothetical protein
MPLQLEQWDDAIGPGLVLADDRRRGDDLSPGRAYLSKGSVWLPYGSNTSSGLPPCAGASAK